MKNMTILLKVFNLFILLFILLFIMLDSGFRRDSEEEIQTNEVINKKGYTRHFDDEIDIENTTIQSKNNDIKSLKELEITGIDVINPLSPEGITSSNNEREITQNNKLISPSITSVCLFIYLFTFLLFI